MKTSTVKKLRNLIIEYENFMNIMEHDAEKAIRIDSRAYGGFIRAAKGKVQEYISENLVRITWGDELSQKTDKLTINSQKIRIPIQMEYVNQIKDKAVREYILANIRKY